MSVLHSWTFFFLKLFTVFLVSLFFPLIPKSLCQVVFTFHFYLMLSLSLSVCPLNLICFFLVLSFLLSLSFLCPSLPRSFIFFLLLISQCRGLLFALNSWLMAHFLSAQVSPSLEIVFMFFCETFSRMLYWESIIQMSSIQSWHNFPVPLWTKPCTGECPSPHPPEPPRVWVRRFSVVNNMTSTIILSVLSCDLWWMWLKYSLQLLKLKIILSTFKLHPSHSLRFKDNNFGLSSITKWPHSCCLSK